MQQRISVSILFCFVLLVGVSLGEDWPTYMQDNTRVGYTPDTLPYPLSEQWVRSSATPPQWAWPGPGGKVVEGLKLEHRVRFDDVFHVAVVGGRVYYGSSVDNTVYCVAAESGETLWRFVTSGPVRLAPAVANGRVLVGSDDGHAYCLDAIGGDLIWKLRAGPRDEWILARGRMASRWPIRTGILVSDGVAYFGAGIFPHETVYLYAVNADTGEVIWKNDTISQRDAGRNDLTPQGYLLATDTQLFVPSGRTLPAAFDRATGRMQHKQKGGGKQVGGAEALLDDDDILSVGEHHILALDQEAGSIDNKYRGRRMTLHGDMAYIADGTHVFAIDRSQYAQVKKDRLRLEGKLAGLETKLLRHRAPAHLEHVRDAQSALEAAQRESANDSDEESAGSETEIAALRQKLKEAKKTYEASRKEYEQLAKDAKTTQEKIEALTGDAIKWRAESPHESSMILTSNLLAVGGASQVTLFDVDTGRPIESLAVESEARGLACADGRLYVSTTAGKIYCFAHATPREAKSDVASNKEANADPYPADELSQLYATAAEQIINRSGATRGYCLVVGSREGRLAYELAKRSSLKIHCVESNATKVAQSRAAFAAAGLYGHRISVNHIELSAYPFPNYFANLIVSDALLTTGSIPGDPVQIARHLKPDGGVMCLGVPNTAKAEVRQRAANRLPEWLNETGLGGEKAVLQAADGWTLLTRKSLPGTAGWTHQYGNPGNTSTVPDGRVRGGVRVLWYGDPGPSAMTNRHEGAVGPVSAAGRLFVQGENSVLAYDAFNGVFLWEKYNPQALRTGVFNNYESGNLVVSNDSVFMVTQDKCLHLDAATGTVIRTYTLPPAAGANPNESHDDTRQWGYVSYANGRLFGTSTVRKLIAAEARRRGRPAEKDNTDQIFAIDTNTGEFLWIHQGQNISHTTIAIDADQLYFVDSSLTLEQREILLAQDKSELEKLKGDARKLAEDRMKRIDARRAVALNVNSGEVAWSHAIDVTDCTGVGIGAGRLTVMVSDGHVVVCGANANGHYWKQFLAGEFKRRRLVVLSAKTGEVKWARDANYRHRPIIVGNRLVAEPWAYALDTGKQLTRTHPLTGERTPWKFIRPGHHCGAISATPNMMFFRSGFTAYYDFESDEGTNHFAGHRLGCWINTIPANGLVMIPEASAGCACLFSLTSTIVFEPHENQSVWSVYTAEGRTRPVQHMALNIGAPGDRRDARGKLWLAYPRPSSRAGLDLPLDLHALSPFGTTGSYFQYNSESYKVTNTDTPWLFSSGMTGMTRCELPLIDEGQPEATYKVRLYFAGLKGDQSKQRVFDIRLQGKTVSKNVDIVEQANADLQAVTLEFDDVHVSNNLAIELLPVAGRKNQNMPSICAMEVVRSGSDAIVRKLAGD